MAMVLFGRVFDSSRRGDGSGEMVILGTRINSLNRIDRGAIALRIRPLTNEFSLANLEVLVVQSMVETVHPPHGASPARGIIPRRFERRRRGSVHLDSV